MTEWLWLVKTVGFLALTGLLGGGFARFGLGLAHRPGLLLFAFAGVVFSAFAEAGLTLQAAVGSLQVGDVLAYLSGSGHGQALLVRMLGGTLVLAALLSAPSWWMVALVALPLLYGYSAAGHARLGAWWSLPVDMVHAGATALWAGAVLAAGFAGRAAWNRWGRDRTPLRRLSALALGCVVALSVTGVASGVERLPSAHAFTSPYGMLLLLKVFVFLFVLVMAAVVRAALLGLRDLRPLHWTLRGEASLLVGIFAISGILTASPPPQNLSEQPPQQLEFTLAGQRLSAELRFVAAGRMRLSIEGASFSAPLYANLHMTGHPMPATPLPLEREAGGYVGETTLWMPGAYLLELKTGREVAQEPFDIR